MFENMDRFSQEMGLCIPLGTMDRSNRALSRPKGRGSHEHHILRHRQEFKICALTLAIELILKEAPERVSFWVSISVIMQLLFRFGRRVF
jgi:hypothetical protein